MGNDMRAALLKAGLVRQEEVDKVENKLKEDPKAYVPGPGFDNRDVKITMPKNTSFTRYGPRYQGPRSGAEIKLKGPRMNIGGLLRNRFGGVPAWTKWLKYTETRPKDIMDHCCECGQKGIHHLDAIKNIAEAGHKEAHKPDATFLDVLDAQFDAALEARPILLVPIDIKFLLNMCMAPEDKELILCAHVCQACQQHSVEILQGKKEMKYVGGF